MSKLFKKADSSDYISYKKRVAIASTAPSILQNNQNFTFIPTTQITDLSNCLIQAQNHELLTDYTSGLNYIELRCDLGPTA
jgi:hypothetical protein